MPRPLSDLSQLPDGLRQAMVSMEAKTDYRWRDVPGFEQKYAVASWTLRNLAGDSYWPDDSWYNPDWRPHNPGPDELQFWTAHLRWWRACPPVKEKTKALAFCVKGVQEARKHGV